MLPRTHLVSLLNHDALDNWHASLFWQEIAVKGKKGAKSITDKKEKDVEVIKKDINSLSKEEQMDVVYR